jgi:Fe-S-cluster containining protein
MQIIPILNDPVLNDLVLNDSGACKPFLDRLQSIYGSMGDRYEQVADYYGFACRGCKDNCCRTRFYHYTLVEYLYLHQGYALLDKNKQGEIGHRALTVQTNQSAAGDGGGNLRQMCPLNANALCLLYEHRPMICRLHGIPYELRKPGQETMQGSGCLPFMEQYAEKEPMPFDRTPLYAEMANLEKALRQAIDFTGRLKMTIADMFAGNRAKEI